MKRVLLLVALLLVAAVAALAWSFAPARLAVGPAPALAVPPAHPPDGMRLSSVPAGRIVVKAALAYRGGAFGETRNFTMTAVLVQHPRGTLVFDTGFGSDVDAQVQSFPWLMRFFTRYEKGTPVAQQLGAHAIGPADLAGIVLTHAHWDHVSGIPDLPGVPVWVNPVERDFIRDGGYASALVRSFGDLPYHVYDFTGAPYLGFDRSEDVFGDGSIVLVPAPGHTPGSIIAFLTLPSGKRYALVGDLVWQREGIELPAERPWLSRSLADADPAGVRRWIVLMHQIATTMPDLLIVPAHDARAFERLPKFPQWVG